MTDRELCIALNMISGIGAGRYQALLETFCTPDGVRQADRSDLMSVDGIGKVIAERIIDFDWDAELARELNLSTTTVSNVIHGKTHEVSASTIERKTMEEF